MKNLILLLFAALFSLSNCTEEIIIEKEKLVYVKDTTKAKPVPTFVATSTQTECSSVDTLDFEVVIKDILHNGGFEKDTLVKLTTACHAIFRIKGYVLVPKDSVPGPTVYLPGDSIPYPVPGPTVYLPGDSIPYPVAVHDTVWQTRIERQIIFKDTLYQPLYWKSLHFVPEELTPFVQEMLAILESC